MDVLDDRQGIRRVRASDLVFCCGCSRRRTARFYVSQVSIVDLALSHFGTARAQPGATVRGARYAGIFETEPFQRTSGGFAVAHPVVVALDLAHDRARGREIVEAWDPGDLGVARVW